MSMFEIIIKKEIHAPSSTVWSVICNTADYYQWNSFVPSCDSTFKVGSPIIMRVRMFPAFVFRQKETIYANEAETLMEYGVRLPVLLRSTRQHVLNKVDEQTTAYESHFRIEGLLAPLVTFVLGRRLKSGFAAMTEGLVSFSEQQHQA